MMGLHAAAAFATVIRFSSPGRQIATPSFVRREVALFWVVGVALVSVGVAAFVVIAANSEVRRRWFAVVPMVVGGLVTLFVGVELLAILA
jgi:hypothetical protein